MNLKNWFANSFLIFLFSSSIFSQTRLDSLHSLTVENFKEPVIVPEGLKEFELNIKPMKLIEPEIYLFGPSDLVPERRFDFNPDSQWLFTLAADHISSVDQLISIVQPGRSVWFSVNENYNRQNYSNSSFEYGKFDFSIGNNQSKQPDIIFDLNGNVELKKSNHFEIRGDSSDFPVFADEIKSLGSISFELKNNQVIYSDKWKLRAEVLNYNNLNSVGLISGSFDKDLTLLTWLNESEFAYFKNIFAKIQTGLKYESENFQMTGQIGIGYLKNSESNKGSDLSRPFSKWNFSFDNTHTHHEIKFKINELNFEPHVYFDSPFWFVSDYMLGDSVVHANDEFSKPDFNQSNSFYTTYYSGSYQLEWIPSESWVLKTKAEVSSSDLVRFASYGELLKERANQICITSDINYFFGLSKISFSYSWNRNYNSAWKDIAISYFAEHTFKFETDLKSVSGNNRLVIGGNYLLSRKTYEGDMFSRASVFTDFSEIYGKIEDFHAKPVKFFAEIKLYLSENQYYPGLVFEKYFYKAGIALQF